MCCFHPVEEMVAFFPDTFLWFQVKEGSKRSIRANNGEFVVLDEDHVGDGIKGCFPFFDRLSHFFFGQLPYR